MERPVLLDPQAQLARLEREGNKDSLVPMVSRVFLDLPALLVREVNPVTWGFLEKLELLVPLDPEVSVDSQEKEAQLDLKVCRVLGVCLVLLEQTGPRELLDPVVPQELRDPRVCKACLEREEELAFPALRETGAI